MDTSRREVARLRRLLRWVYRECGADWALICDEECEIEEIAAEPHSSQAGSAPDRSTSAPVRPSVRVRSQ